MIKVKMFKRMLTILLIFSLMYANANMAIFGVVSYAINNVQVIEETKKEEISNKKDDSGQRAEKKVVSGKNKKVKEILKKNTKIETEQDDYLDDDVDDYVEKDKKI